MRDTGQRDYLVIPLKSVRERDILAKGQTLAVLTKANACATHSWSETTQRDYHRLNVSCTSTHRFFVVFFVSCSPGFRLMLGMR